MKDDAEEDDDKEIPYHADGQFTEAKPQTAWISTLATSDDGQWLAGADLLRRVYIFNLDTLRQTAILPTLPTVPLILAFPPAHPSLLSIVWPSGVLTFYHLEHRRLLPPTTQLQTLNTVFRAQYTPGPRDSLRTLPIESQIEQDDHLESRLDLYRSARPRDTGSTSG